jgi:glycosyltransferase involved in cell wall biosynthesis
VEQSPLRNKIKVFPRMKTHSNLAELMSYSNCGIYISRGEGWNLELLETMAMDKPVIASNYSAHTEYCNENNSFLVDMDEKELAVDNKWFFGTSQWAKIGQNQIDQTVEHMKYCYTNNVKTNEKGLETAKNLSWQNSANQIVKAMLPQVADTLV